MSFFGHADAPKEVVPELRRIIKYLIETHGVKQFYIKIQGCFDIAAHRVMMEMEKEYTHIQYYLISSEKPSEESWINPKKVLVPKGVEEISSHFADFYCNRWMLEQSQYVVTYVTHVGDDAAKYKALAKKQKKVVLNISDT